MKKLVVPFIAAFAAITLAAQNNIVEEVAWVIGDEPIYKSEIEQTYQDMQSDRTPIAGDPVYNPESKAPRLMLHAGKLEITIPGKAGNERKVFEAELPAEFIEYLEQN